MNTTRPIGSATPNLGECLVIGISSRALFDLEEENRVFEREGLEAYRSYQRLHEGEILKPGTAFPLVQALLNLNRLAPQKRMVEVIVMSRNTADTGLRVFSAIHHHQLDISRAAFTGGAGLAPYLANFEIDLFLSKSEPDVQAAIDSGFAAALIYDPPDGFAADTETIRIAFDADAVIFSEESERIFKSQGLEAFAANEKARAHEDLAEGPLGKLLKMLSHIQRQFPRGSAPVRIALVTARGSPSHERVIRTLRSWDVHIDEAFFLGGLKKKAEILKAFRAHIFFDDQEVHLAGASQMVPSARVPYRSDSPLQGKKSAG